MTMTETTQQVKRLWTSAECCIYLNVTSRQFVDRITTLPDFPKGIRWPTPDGGKSLPRYEQDEIINWAHKYKVAA